MGLSFSSVEGLTVPKQGVVQKLLNSSDFLRIYINGTRKIYADKRTNKQVTHINTTADSKRLQKNANTLEIVHEKSISFVVGYVYTNPKKEVMVRTHMFRSEMKTDTSKREIAVINSPDMKFLHYIAVFVPNNSSRSYSKFPEDVYKVIEGKLTSLKNELNTVKHSILQEKNAKVLKKQEIDNAVQRALQDKADKKKKTKEDKKDMVSIEGFNPLKRRVLWSADGTMKMMDM